MNLTKTDKEAFVNAVIADIPTVDYDGQIAKMAQEYAITLLPKELRDALKANPAVEEHLDTQYLHFCGVGVRTLGMAGRTAIHNNEELQAKGKVLEELSDAQAARINDMRISLTGIINTCRTLKQAKAKLPEFEKYLPAEREKTGVTNLPVANVIADLTRLGWPKHEQKAA